MISQVLIVFAGIFFIAEKILLWLMISTKDCEKGLIIISGIVCCLLSIIISYIVVCNSKRVPLGWIARVRSSLDIEEREGFIQNSVASDDRVGGISWTLLICSCICVIPFMIAILLGNKCIED